MASLWAGLAQDMGITLIHSLGQLTVVAILLWSCLLLVPRRMARIRYAMASLALLAALIWPVATFGSLRQARDRAIAARQGAYQAPSALSRQPLQDYVLHHRVEMAKPLLPWLAGAWGLGVLGFGCRLLSGLAVLRRLRRHCAGAPGWMKDRVAALAGSMGLRPPDVQLSEIGPCLFGALHPVLLLPAACISGLPPQCLDAILAHELAHLKRLDYPVQLLQSLVEVLLFHHPCTYWISSVVRFERERCCDEIASQACGGARSVAQALLHLDGIRPPRTALAAGGTPMFDRIQCLMGLPKTPNPLARIGALCCLGVALAALPLLKAEGSRKFFKAPAKLVALADQESREQGLDPYLVRAMIQCESAYKVRAVSRAGAQGLMQLIPKTAGRMGGGDMFDPAVNVKAGTRFLRGLMDRYQGNVALAVMAYNAGPDAVDQAEGVAPTEESRVYALAVLDLYRRKAVEPDPALD